MYLVYASHTWDWHFTEAISAFRALWSYEKLSLSRYKESISQVT